MLRFPTDPQNRYAGTGPLTSTGNTSGTNTVSGTQTSSGTNPTTQNSGTGTTPAFENNTQQYGRVELKNPVSFPTSGDPDDPIRNLADKLKGLEGYSKLSPEAKAYLERMQSPAGNAALANNRGFEPVTGGDNEKYKVLMELLKLANEQESIDPEMLKTILDSVQDMLKSGVKLSPEEQKALTDALKPIGAKVTGSTGDIKKVVEEFQANCAEELKNNPAIKFSVQNISKQSTNAAKTKINEIQQKANEWGLSNKNNSFSTSTLNQIVEKWKKDGVSEQEILDRLDSLKNAGSANEFKNAITAMAQEAKVKANKFAIDDESPAAFDPFIDKKETRKREEADAKYWEKEVTVFKYNHKDKDFNVGSPDLGGATNFLGWVKGILGAASYSNGSDSVEVKMPRRLYKQMMELYEAGKQDEAEKILKQYLDKVTVPANNGEQQTNGTGKKPPEKVTDKIDIGKLPGIGDK